MRVSEKRGFNPLRSINPKDYESLPRLAAPAGYICLIRDIDSDSYRIEGTAQPGQYIETVLNETGRKFGIELVSILAAEDLTAAEADLYRRYQARLSGDWLELDLYQLEELRRSILRIDAYASCYLTPQRPPYASQERSAEKISRRVLLANRNSPFSNRSRWKRRIPGPPLPERRYGARSLRRNQAPSENRGEERLSLGDRASDLFEDAFVNHPGKVIMAILLLMFIVLVYLQQNWHSYLTRW